MQKPQEQTSRCVTWPQFITTQLVICGMMLAGIGTVTSAGYWVYSDHVNQKHNSDEAYIKEREFKQVIDRLNRIENKLDVLKGIP